MDPDHIRNLSRIPPLKVKQTIPSTVITAPDRTAPHRTGTEWIRAQTNGAEWSRTEPSGAEQSGPRETAQNRGEPNREARIRAGRVEPRGAEPSRGGDELRRTVRRLCREVCVYVDLFDVGLTIGFQLLLCVLRAYVK